MPWYPAVCSGPAGCRELDHPADAINQTRIPNPEGFVSSAAVTPNAVRSSGERIGDQLGLMPPVPVRTDDGRFILDPILAARSGTPSFSLVVRFEGLEMNRPGPDE